MPSRVTVVRLAAPLVALCLLAACGHEEERLARPEGSALWVAPADLGVLTADDREALRRGDVRELFLEAGRLTAATGGAPVVEPRADLSGADVSGSARLPVTLVVRGAWPAALDAESAAPALAGELRSLRRGAEDAGLVVAGYHLDLELPRGGEALERSAATLRRTRRELGERLFLSVSLDPRTLDGAGVDKLVSAVDFVVPFLYGQRPDGGPGPGPRQAWTLHTVDQGVERLRELEAPFLLGIGTVGQLHRLGVDGQPVDSTSHASLSSLLYHRALGPGRSAVLEVQDRQTYNFEVERPVTLGEWQLRRGEELQVSRLSTYHLRQAAARAEAIAPLLHLGELFDRLPREGENLSPGPASLAGAALGSSTVPDLVVELQPRGGSARFQVVLRNRGAQPTEVSSLEHNYVELRALGGAAFRNVNPGEFRRFELESEGRKVANMQALRNADTLKLYVPVLEAGQRVESGVIALAGTGGDPVMEVTGRFILPSGELLHLPLRPWPAPADAAPGEAGAESP